MKRRSVMLKDVESCLILTGKDHSVTLARTDAVDCADFLELVNISVGLSSE
jgi:hypothetical protein